MHVSNAKILRRLLAASGFHFLVTFVAVCIISSALLNIGVKQIENPVTPEIPAIQELQDLE